MSGREISAILLLTLAGLFGCDTPPDAVSADDFARSDRFLLADADDDFRNARIGFRWLDNGRTLAFRFQHAESAEFRQVATGSGQQSLLFDHQRMLSALNEVRDDNTQLSGLPIRSALNHDATAIVVPVGENVVTCDLVTYECDGNDKNNETGSESAANSPANASPSGTKSLTLRDHNLWLQTEGDGTETQLTTDGENAWSYANYPESNTAAIMIRREGIQPSPVVAWSADGGSFASFRLDERQVPELHLVQSIPDDGAFRPALQSYRFDLPGDPVAVAQHFIYHVNTAERVEIDYRPLPSAVRPPMAVAHVWWGPAGDYLYMIDAPTEESVMRLVRIDARTGRTTLLVEEPSSTHVGPSPDLDGLPNVRILSSGDFVWYSERSGWGHLYYHNGSDGRQLHPITHGDWLVRNVLHVDSDERYIYFSASGRESDRSIYNRKLYRAALDGSGVELLTPEPGDHDVAASLPPEYHIAEFYGIQLPASFSPDGSFFVDRFGAADQPETWLLRRNDGAIVSELAVTDYAPLPPFTMPEVVSVRSADDEWDLYGVILKPGSFDPNERYPVIDSIYPGPQVIRQPTFFSGEQGGRDGAVMGQAQALADLGFIVVIVDGRGTPLRSKAFRELSYRRMESAGTLEDHIAAIRQMAANRPYMDLDRVGIYGSSGGGFATAHALIDFPDFFKVGVASAGNHEQRAYLSTWGGTYHGPFGEVDYDKVFAGRNAEMLQGRLLLAHGELDDNVHPAGTMRLVDALIKAGKQFDMLIMPNVHHGISGDPYFQRRLQNYFIRHLRGADLPSDSDLVPAGGYE